MMYQQRYQVSFKQYWNIDSSKTWFDHGPYSERTFLSNWYYHFRWAKRGPKGHFQQQYMQLLTANIRIQAFQSNQPQYVAFVDRRRPNMVRARVGNSIYIFEARWELDGFPSSSISILKMKLEIHLAPYPFWKWS